jgi:bifunctional DNA-binding transcriptional regulator/antitoxin component of YhaV-PrlF toxin-antitoxin module
MKTTKFKSTVKKGNNKGVGFISIPIEKRNLFSIDGHINIIINSKIEFFSKIKFYGTIGFYIPYKIMIENKLIGKYINVEVKKIEGFFTSIGSDGRIYIPQNIAEKYSLKFKDIVEIEFNRNNEKNTRYCLMNIRQRKNTKEYMCMFDFKRSRQDGIFRLKRKLSKNLQHSNFPKQVLKDFNIGNIGDKRVICYFGNRMPIIINLNSDIGKMAYYLGCYFADGTKRGTHWGICASTFEQAKYYKDMHEMLIRNSKIVNNISYSDPENKDKEFLKNKLRNLWHKRTGIILKNVSVRIHDTQYRAPNRNEYGTLVFKENRELTRIYYVRFLDFILDKINNENNQKLAIDFILGVLEGDGCSNAKSRGHVMIATNMKDSKILKNILISSNLKFNIRGESENRYSVYIWSLEIIKNISILKDKLFKYYPKRRKILKERLANTGCARFLLGKNKKTSNWLIGQLKNYEILDEKNNLTNFGKSVKKDLKEFFDSKD